MRVLIGCDGEDVGVVGIWGGYGGVGGWYSGVCRMWSG